MGPSCFHVQVKFAFCFFGTNKFVGSIENLNRRTNRPSFFYGLKASFSKDWTFLKEQVFSFVKKMHSLQLFSSDKRKCAKAQYHLYIFFFFQRLFWHKSTISFVMSDDVNFLHYSFSVEGRMLREVIQSINLIIVQLSTFQDLTYLKDTIWGLKSMTTIHIRWKQGRFMKR